MNTCLICGRSSDVISKTLKLCIRCIRQQPEHTGQYIAEAHDMSRRPFHLPAIPPQAHGGVPCNICMNECRIPEKGYGYCGLRKNVNGHLTGVTAERGNLSWYHDPLPTNCVAAWVCPGGCGSGYPEYSHAPEAEHGYQNLAVFFHSCSLNCLFCQNWHFREKIFNVRTNSVQELVNAVDSRTSCICYFGGDPSPQLPFAIKASRRARDMNRDRILRICWETNGTMNRGLLREVVDLSLESGGCIKFDLKAWNENLHKSLTGVTNKRILDNFAFVAGWMKERSKPPLLIASTLLIPGYIDAEEVSNIAYFIASHDTDIPYALLCFYPHFFFADLPLTSKIFVYQCLEAAQEAGLKRVRIGNEHLLK